MVRNTFGVYVAVIISIAAAAGTPANSAGADDELLAQARQVLSPLPKDMATSEFSLTPEKVELGRKLFFDPRMSVDGSASCSRCHLPSLYGADGLAKSLGARGKLNGRNAPTVLNAALQFNAHWIGDRANVEDQAKRGLVGPASFGNPDYASAMAKLKAIADYPRLFAKAFPGESDPVTPENWGKAIGAYERTLVTPSRFDEYLGGNANALSANERNGLRLFMETGCVACHNGPGLGGAMFQKFGVTEDYWKETGVAQPDKGRFDATKDPADLYVFKVPTLRNVAMTAPYFHDGSVRTLPEAVRIMAKVQLDKTLAETEVQDLTAFLSSLTGKLPANFVETPELPAGSFEATPSH